VQIYKRYMVLLSYHAW